MMKMKKYYLKEYGHAYFDLEKIGTVHPVLNKFFVKAVTENYVVIRDELLVTVLDENNFLHSNQYISVENFLKFLQKGMFSGSLSDIYSLLELK